MLLLSESQSRALRLVCGSGACKRERYAFIRVCVNGGRGFCLLNKFPKI